jgi:hypothetical protein
MPYSAAFGTVSHCSRGCPATSSPNKGWPGYGPVAVRSKNRNALESLDYPLPGWDFDDAAGRHEGGRHGLGTHAGLRHFDGELPAWNEYLTAENRILKAQLNGRLKLSDAKRSMLGQIGHRLGSTALAEVATVAKPDTILAWYRKLLTHKFDGSKAHRGPGRPRVTRKVERRQFPAAPRSGAGAGAQAHDHLVGVHSHPLGAGAGTGFLTIWVGALEARKAAPRRGIAKAIGMALLIIISAASMPLVPLFPPLALILGIALLYLACKPSRETVEFYRGVCGQSCY